MTNTQPNPDVALAEYEYNGLNQKIKRESSGSSLDDVFYYFGAGNQLIEEEKVTGGATLKCHIWGTQYIDDAVATANGSGTFTFLAHADQHNTVTEIDDAGSVLRRQLYHGFGLPTQVAANWLSYETITEDKSLFTGRLYHLDHAAYDFRNRFEDPEIAVFSQRDPIGIWGDGGNFGNGYTFLGNDAINYRDPLGLTACKELSGAVVDPPQSVVFRFDGNTVEDLANLYASSCHDLATKVCRLGKCPKRRQSCYAASEASVHIIKIRSRTEGFGKYSYGVIYLTYRVTCSWRCRCDRTLRIRRGDMVASLSGIGPMGAPRHKNSYHSTLFTRNVLENITDHISAAALSQHPKELTKRSGTLQYGPRSTASIRSQ